MYVVLQLSDRQVCDAWGPFSDQQTALRFREEVQGELRACPNQNLPDLWTAMIWVCPPEERDEHALAHVRQALGKKRWADLVSDVSAAALDRARIWGVHRAAVLRKFRSK